MGRLALLISLFLYSSKNVIPLLFLLDNNQAYEHSTDCAPNRWARERRGEGGEYPSRCVHL